MAEDLDQIQLPLAIADGPEDQDRERAVVEAEVPSGGLSGPSGQGRREPLPVQPVVHRSEVMVGIQGREPLPRGIGDEDHLVRIAEAR